MMSDYPYTLDDEPTEDWTVENVLQWWLLRANAESEAEYNTIVEGLGKQLEEGKKAIWEAHEQVSEIIRDSDNVENENVPSNQSNNNDNNNNKKSINNDVQKQAKNKRQSIEKPKQKAVSTAVAAALTRPTRSKKPSAVVIAAAESANAAALSSAPPPLSKKPDTIHIDVVGGPYDGKFYDLQPKTKRPAWIGRSSSAKFKDRGISLPMDLEVSTSHGKFEFKQGKFYFVDVASTNGTRINGEDCVPNHSYELNAKGTTILAGQTTMKVTLLKLA